MVLILVHIVPGLCDLTAAVETFTPLDCTYLLFEEDGGLQARHDVQDQTTGCSVEARLSAVHDVHVQQLQTSHLDQIKLKQLERPLVAACSITDLKVISQKFSLCGSNV